MHAKPVVVLDPDGHYDGLLRWLHGLGEGGFLHDGALARVVVGADVDAALDACAAAATVALTPTTPHAGFTQNAARQNRHVRFRRSPRAPAAMPGARVAIGNAADPDRRRPRRRHASRDREVVRRPHLPGPAWTASGLVAAKAGRRVSVVLPALDEEETVGAIVAAIVPLTRGDAPLVDELVVVDSGSTDRTIAVATAAGARVVRRTDVVPHLPPLPGKGEVLWRSLAATTGDVIVFLDSDLVDFDPAFVPSLLGPILTLPGVGLVKGFYRRPLRLETPEEESLEHGGGRVTELLARPLLAALRPELAGRGAAAGRGVRGDARAAGVGAVRVRVRRGDRAAARHPRPARARRAGAGQPGGAQAPQPHLLQLGVMSRQILAAALRRCERDRLAPAPLTQFLQVGGEWLPTSTAVDATERPPMRELLGDPLH